MRAYALLFGSVLTVSACGGPSTTTPATAASQASAPGAVLYEGATLIAGDSSAPVERAAFVVHGHVGECSPTSGAT